MNLLSISAAVTVAMQGRAAVGNELQTRIQGTKPHELETNIYTTILIANLESVILTLV